MRNLLKRLEDLERVTLTRKPPRIIRHIVSPGGQQRADVARCDGATIKRDAAESVEAFEARALSHFTGQRIIISGEPCAI